VADHLGCEFHPRTVSPDIVTLLPRLAWHFDEPFADSSAVPTYYVSKAARELVTVALSGDGGDELWAGYTRHRVEQWEQRARTALGPAATAAAAIGGALPLSVKGARALRHLGAQPGQAYALKHAYGMFEPGAKARLYSGDFAAATRGADPFARFRDLHGRCQSSDPIDRALYVDVHTYMVDDILTKVDRMSMAVSLEARDPLLDHRLLEFAATVPASLKIRGGRGKYLLRKVLQRRIPAEILERGKHGFEAPIGEWLRGPLAPTSSGSGSSSIRRRRGAPAMRRPSSHVRHRRNRRVGSAARRRALAARAHARRHDAPRPGRCGPVPRRAGRTGPPPPEHRRSRRRPSAAVE
jgi:asparagine synthase (glutamine-hydrolysing)